MNKYNIHKYEKSSLEYFIQNYKEIMPENFLLMQIGENYNSRCPEYDAKSELLWKTSAETINFPTIGLLKSSLEDLSIKEIRKIPALDFENLRTINFGLIIGENKGIFPLPYLKYDEYLYNFGEKLLEKNLKRIFPREFYINVKRYLDRNFSEYRSCLEYEIELEFFPKTKKSIDNLKEPFKNLISFENNFIQELNLFNKSIEDFNKNYLLRKSLIQ
jgi:hypothetical protein